MSFDREAVKVLAEQYASAGLADTRAGRFLTDVAGGVDPKGGGVSWLNDLLRKGDPSPNVDLAAELGRLVTEYPTLYDRLAGVRKNLSGPYGMPDWGPKVIEEARRSAATGVWVMEGDDQALITICEKLCGVYSPYYWAQRQSIHNRAKTIFFAAATGKTLLNDDKAFLEKTFSAQIRKLKGDKFKVGDLVRIPGVAGLIPGIITSGPRVGSWGVVHTVLADGTEREVHFDSIKKRMK